MCGGTKVGLERSQLGKGLSPRVRGNPFQVEEIPLAVGSIPACAGEPAQRSATRWRWRVYPRVCGGTIELNTKLVEGAGLSPRVRGNPRSGSAGGRGRGVYPRVCGGTAGSSWAAFRQWGLSPRVRGNRSNGCAKPTPQGSIPACAGEPRLRGGRPCAGRVYPRVCGGTRARPGRRRRLGGLSPRVRGNRRQHEVESAGFGSIPACAGEPLTRTVRGDSERVYPRVCGGTFSMRAMRFRRKGLSPRVRGNRAPRVRALWWRGSIPACAGEPASSPPARLRDRVYPRVCGGTRLPNALLKVGAGLSPRVRGNLERPAALPPRAGSIPACAGEPAPANP